MAFKCTPGILVGAEEPSVILGGGNLGGEDDFLKQESEKAYKNSSNSSSAQTNSDTQYDKVVQKLLSNDVYTLTEFLYTDTDGNSDTFFSK